MSRIACLRIPQFQIAVHQKHEPELKGKPFVLLNGKLTAGTTARVRVLMCSPAARRKNIVPGMRLSEALVTCADAVWRESCPSLYLDAQKKLVRTLISLSPRVTAQDMGIFLLDASGLRHLGGESKFCRDLLVLCSKAGFTTGLVGIADTAFAATMATTLKERRWHRVPPEGDAAFLSPFSIRHLPVDSDIHEALGGLGIKSMGQLSRLSASAVQERFGQEGALAHQLARGLDDRQPYIPALEPEFHCFVELGFPVEQLSDILFVLKSMLDRLMSELTHKGLWAEELTISLYSDKEKLDARPVRLIRASNNTKFLLEVLRLSLEASPVAREFTGIGLSVSRFCEESWGQLCMSEALPKKCSPAKANPSSQPSNLPESLMLLLQRFSTRIGDSALTRPLANDQHPLEHAGLWLPLLAESAASSVIAVDSQHIKAQAGQHALSAGLALRRSPQATPLLMELADSKPVALNYKGRWHKIKASTTPERLSGQWWDTPIHKSYYMALVEPAGTAGDKDGSDKLILLVHDHRQKTWFLDGFFD